MTKQQMVHVGKLALAALPGFIGAIAPGFPQTVQLVLYGVSAILGAAELNAHGHSVPSA